MFIKNIGDVGGVDFAGRSHAGHLPLVWIVEDNMKTAYGYFIALRQKFVGLTKKDAELFVDANTVSNRMIFDDRVPTLILLDHNLKGAPSGLDLLRLIRLEEEYERVPVLSISRQPFSDALKAEYESLGAIILPKNFLTPQDDCQTLVSADRVQLFLESFYDIMQHADTLLDPDTVRGMINDWVAKISAEDARRAEAAKNRWHHTNI